MRNEIPADWMLYRVILVIVAVLILLTIAVALAAGGYTYFVDVFSPLLRKYFP